MARSVDASQGGLLLAHLGRFLRGLTRGRALRLGSVLGIADSIPVGIRVVGIGFARIDLAVAIGIFFSILQTVVVAIGILGIGRILGLLLLAIGKPVLVAVGGALVRRRLGLRLGLLLLRL